MTKRTRQYLGVLAAIAAYYLVHEGAHFLCAILMGTFESVHFMEIGMQVVVDFEQMSAAQLGIFCLAGSASTLLVGYILCALTAKICTSSSKVFRAIFYYITIAFLVLDPLYLSILCGFFGGGGHERYPASLPGMDGKSWLWSHFACKWHRILEKSSACLQKVF